MFPVSGEEFWVSDFAEELRIDSREARLDWRSWRTLRVLSDTLISSSSSKRCLSAIRRVKISSFFVVFRADSGREDASVSESEFPEAKKFLSCRTLSAFLSVGGVNGISDPISLSDSVELSMKNFSSEVVWR